MIEKRVGSKVLSRCVLHIVTSPNRNQAPHKNAPTPRQQFARSGALLRFFEISAFLSILAAACRAQKRERDGRTDGRGIHALRGSKHEKGARRVAQHAAGGVGTDLSANIPNHERPEEIAGQRSATSLPSCDTPSSSRGRWRGS